MSCWECYVPPTSYCCPRMSSGACCPPPRRKAILPIDNLVSNRCTPLDTRTIYRWSYMPNRGDFRRRCIPHCSTVKRLLCVTRNFGDQRKTTHRMSYMLPCAMPQCGKSFCCSPPLDTYRLNWAPHCYL